MTEVGKTIAEQFADFVTSWEWDDFPDDVREQAKLSVLDTIGVTIRGSAQESTRIVRDLALANGSAQESTLVGTGEKVSVLDAAFVNGTSAHSLELDDHMSHKRSFGHPGVVSIPAALALGEAHTKNGQEILTAIIHGYEVTSRLNDAVPPGFDNYKRGFHGTAITGTFGASAISGKLLGLTTDHLANAFGICGSLTAGSFEYNASGAWTKRLHAGQSGRNGLLAALLAKRGFTGPHSAIEGRHGFLNSYFGKGNYNADVILDGLGHDWALRHMMYKPYACSGVLHSPMTSAEAVMRKHKVNADDIERVLVHTSSTVIEELTNPRERKVRPRTAVDAQFSLPFVVAMIIVRGKALLEEFSDQGISDPQVREVAHKVEFIADRQIDDVWPEEEPSGVELHLKSGSVVSAWVPGPKGGLKVPMTTEDLTAKFVDLVAPVLGDVKAQRIVDMVYDFEDLADIHDLARFLS